MDDLHAFYGPNAGYVLELYDRYVENPGTVDPEARALFAQWSLEPNQAVGAEPAIASAMPTSQMTADQIDRVTRVSHYARTIRARGHLAAQLDPLGGAPPGDPGLDPAGSGVTPEDLRSLPASVIGGPSALDAANAGEAIERLRRIYCGTIGYDYAHIQVAEERTWLRDVVESGRYMQPLDARSKRQLLERLTEVEAFESFLHRNLPGQKRFSIEGTDLLVPMLDSVIRDAAALGTREVVMGMAHRGRLNVLAHVLGKPYSQIFVDFQRASSGPTTAPSEHFAHYGWTGDVKYHLGARRTLSEGDTAQVQVTLAPNPSHLEFVNPVIQGMARALQERRDAPGYPTQDVDAALAILIHGDAAFPGEGVVSETLNLSRLAGYTTGGTINIIANNQLGFTTGPQDARSTLYASDLAKGFEIPIVHVNADDPEACVAVAHLAYAYRARFSKDFLIDLVGYRRWGHNEGDEPAFTQPMMYQQVRDHPSVRAIWAARLQAEGLLSHDDAEAMLKAALARLQEIFPRSVAEPVQEERISLPEVEPPTAMPAEELAALSRALLARPAGFTTHARLERLFQAREAALAPEGTVDWAHAEALALASLLAAGTPIRMVGQDTERGTFSQRHLVLHDSSSGTPYVPLHSLPQARASFAIYNSPLSEAAALGFEYGYSGQARDVLVLWEAQYGDFTNAAQVILDQFISASRAKWREQHWLVLLLPHGYEGQGPEHSSARLERFLQLAGGDNLRVANCTTAAQYFHLLRRQAALREIDPRPLIVMAPKSLLRHPMASSPFSELAQGRFLPVIDDSRSGADRQAVTRLVLCSGKIYVDLVSSPTRLEAERVAVVRVEELYPFPAAELSQVLAGYPHLRELIWLQEEPKNMGAWSYMAPRLRDLIGRDPHIDYIGRPDRASPAEGSPVLHMAEQTRIVGEAFSGLQGPRAVPQGVKHAG